MTIFIIILGVILVILAYKVHANMALRNEFISIISHKFRTPLTSVSWLAENLINTEKDNFRKKDLQDIQISNQKLISLTNTLIALTDTGRAYKKQYKFEEILVSEFVNACAKPFKDIAGSKNIFFSIKSDDESLKVNVDKARFEFVINTLLENAVTYTKTGGKVEVSITSRGNKAIVNVLDSGIGISKFELTRIFKEFYRAPNAAAFDTEGLGVALFLAQRTIHRLKGEIRVSSEGEGFGSVFEVVLPRVK